MVDWKEVNGTQDTDKLREAKVWLFKENARLENAKRELDRERRLLEEETVFFDKKLAILKDGFRKLDEDRQVLERQKRELARERTSYLEDHSGAGRGSVLEETVQTLFRGTDNSLTLRKRYRDLVKIFHPDNLCGDEELVQMINREYIRRKNG